LLDHPGHLYVRWPDSGHLEVKVTLDFFVEGEAITPAVLFPPRWRVKSKHFQVEVLIIIAL